MWGPVGAMARAPMPLPPPQVTCTPWCRIWSTTGMCGMRQCRLPPMTGGWSPVSVSADDGLRARQGAPNPCHPDPIHTSLSLQTSRRSTTRSFPDWWKRCMLLMESLFSSLGTALAACTCSISYCVSPSLGRITSSMASSLLGLPGVALSSPCWSWPQVRGWHEAACGPALTPTSAYNARPRVLSTTPGAGALHLPRSSEPGLNH